MVVRNYTKNADHNSNFFMQWATYISVLETLGCKILPSSEYAIVKENLKENDRHL